MDGRFSSAMFIPMFVLFEHAHKIRKILLSRGIEEIEGLPWEHIKDHLDHCCLIVNGRKFEITPIILPLFQSNYFKENVRRIYLTATIPTQASFVRTFGIRCPKIIQPSGKSGEAQRLFVFVSGENDDEQRNSAKTLVSKYKSCVISPSYKLAENWVPPATIFNPELGQTEINRFCKSNETEMLSLVAKYDQMIYQEMDVKY